jgi:hypothetical protein
MTGERAQASVETVVLLPVLVLLGLAAWQVLLAVGAAGGAGLGGRRCPCGERRRGCAGGGRGFAARLDARHAAHVVQRWPAGGERRRAVGDPGFRPAYRGHGGRWWVSRSSGQASVELVVVVGLLAAVGLWDVLAVVRAQDAAQRLADRAAVVTLERRPVSSARDGQTVRVEVGRVVAEVRVCALTAAAGCFAVSAQARLPG